MLSEVQLIACLLLPSGCISLSRIYEGGARVVCDLCHTFAHLGPDPSGARVRQKSALSQKCLVSRGDNHYVAVAQFRTLGAVCWSAGVRTKGFWSPWPSKVNSKACPSCVPCGTASPGWF